MKNQSIIYGFLFQKNLFLDSTRRESFAEKDMNNQSINQSTHFYFKNLFLDSVQRESFTEKDINNQSINLRIFISKIFFLTQRKDKQNKKKNSTV